MFKLGKILLSVWGVFQLVFAVGILLSMGLFHQNAPALRILFGAESIANIEPRALATINSMAVLLNGLAAAVSFLLLCLVWKGLKRKDWVFWILVFAFIPLQFSGFWSDAYFSNKNLVANLFSTLLLCGGLLAVGLGLPKTKST